MSIHNISIKSKLLFIVLLPLIALFVLVGMKVMDLHRAASISANIDELISISVAANTLVHELQKERGYTAVFMSTKGERMAKELLEQRAFTDEKRAILLSMIKKVNTDKFGSNYNKGLGDAIASLQKLDNMREKISGFHSPVIQAVSYFTNMNDEFISITKWAIATAQSPEIVKRASVYLYFLKAKEKSGIERAVGATGFGNGWTPELIKNFSGLIRTQEAFTDVFINFATADQKSFYEKMTQSEAFKVVDSFREQAFSSVETNDSMQSVGAADWFNAMTKKINLLKEVEDQLATDVSNVAVTEADQGRLERNLYIAILGTLIILISLCTFIIIRDLLHNINSTAMIMANLANGNTEIVVEGAGRKDEIGNMARSIELFREGLIEKKKLEQESSKAQARAEKEKQELMEKLARDFDNQVGGLIASLGSASTELQSTAQSMRSIANQTSEFSQTVASSSEEASSNVNAVASAMEEMSASSSEITSQISNTRTLSSDTSDDAERTNETVSNLNDLVSNIGEVVSAIRNIAEQTNLLALNATIEAARAGESGKGFAVVAEEVKKLATETGKKTDEIENRITEIQNATGFSVEAVQRIINNVSRINEAITTVSSAAEEQNATNSEINRSVTIASQGVQNVTQIISDVQKGAAETGSSADAVLTAASELAQLSENLKYSVDQFLDKIRSGGSSDRNEDQEESERKYA